MEEQTRIRSSVDMYNPSYEELWGLFWDLKLRSTMLHNLVPFPIALARFPRTGLGVA